MVKSMVLLLLVGAVLVNGDPSYCGQEVYLSVYVDSASVADKDAVSKSDPYCRVSAGGHEKTTSTKYEDNHPSWHEMLDLGCVDAESTTIRVHCLDDDGPANKDDELLDEHLAPEVWYAGSSGDPYTLGGSNHHVKIQVYYLETPTAAPTISIAPSPSPSLLPTPFPSALPTQSPKPTLAPTVVRRSDVAEIQETDSNRYDATPESCYDSPALGKRVEIAKARVIQFIDTTFATTGTGPWSGIRLRNIWDEELFDCATIKGTVVEVEGETALDDVVLFHDDDCTLAYHPVETANFAGGCGSLEVEKFEGVPVELERCHAVVFETHLEVDDGSGPAIVLPPDDDAQFNLFNPGDKLVMTNLRGVIVYERLATGDLSYALRASGFNQAVHVDDFSSPPTRYPTPVPTTPWPTREPTKPPSPRPTMATPSKSHHSSSSDKKKKKDSGAGIIILVAFSVLVIATLLMISVYFRYTYTAHGGGTSSDGIPRRPSYSRHRSSHISEQTFEMGVVEAIGYDDDSTKQSRYVDLRNHTGQDEHGDPTLILRGDDDLDYV